MTPTEINVAYVGFTRAMQRLYLPYEFRNVLSPKWTTLLESYQKTFEKEGSFFA
jgi:superfamily I DNA/RNA helicase